MPEPIAEAPATSDPQVARAAEEAPIAEPQVTTAPPVPSFVARHEPTPEPVAEVEEPTALVAETTEPEAADAETAPETPVPVRTVRTAAERRPTTHHVRRGETLYGIASRYGMTLSQLKALNGLSLDTIRPGQRLRVSGEAPAPARVAPPAPRPTTHRVRSGDNLTRIAQRYGVTVRQLREWNGLRSETIRPGQRLRVAAPGSRG